MGLLSNLKEVRDANKSGVYSANPTEEQLAAMTPEQREAVGERQAIVQQAMADAAEQAGSRGRACWRRSRCTDLRASFSTPRSCRSPTQERRTRR